MSSKFINKPHIFPKQTIPLTETTKFLVALISLFSFYNLSFIVKIQVFIFVSLCLWDYFAFVFLFLNYSKSNQIIAKSRIHLFFSFCCCLWATLEGPQDYTWFWLGDFLWEGSVTMCGERDWTPVGSVQDGCLIHCIITPAPFFLIPLCRCIIYKTSVPNSVLVNKDIVVCCVYVCVYTVVLSSHLPKPI